MGWLDITEDLTDKGRELPAGTVLIFDYEGSPLHLKIMRHAKGRVWAKKNYLYHPDEVQIKDKKRVFNDGVRQRSHHPKSR